MADQALSPLTDADEQRLSDQRAVVTRYLDEDGRKKFETAAGKLGTLRALLEANGSGQSGAAGATGTGSPGTTGASGQGAGATSTTPPTTPPTTPVTPPTDQR